MPKPPMKVQASYTAVPPGCSLTAEETVNIVRSRAGQPDVATTLPFYTNNVLPYSEETGSDEPFRFFTGMSVL